MRALRRAVVSFRCQIESFERGGSATSRRVRGWGLPRVREKRYCDLTSNPSTFGKALEKIPEVVEYSTATGACWPGCAVETGCGDAPGAAAATSDRSLRAASADLAATRQDELGC